MSTPIGGIAVVVPSRNEARLLPRALLALEAALTHLRRQSPQLHASLTVVLDSTTDNSAQVVAAHPQVRVVRVSAGRVGAARNAGIAQAMSLAPVQPHQLWIANTDADSTVPADWLSCHLAVAETGAHVLAGTVEPLPADLPGAALKQWLALHELRDGHGHVHGANLGFRADVYETLGGFGDQGLHEDRDFVASARLRGFQVAATDSARVGTSGRLQGRADGGFAGFLARLDGCADLSELPAQTPAG